MTILPDIYHERLSPSLWALVGACVCAPMAALVVVPFFSGWALPVGIIVAVLIVALLVWASPSVRVRQGMLIAGRASIPVDLLGESRALLGEDARRLRGPGMPRDAWHLFRGGIEGIVVVPVIDPEDPTPLWLLSSRTPERLCAAIARAQEAHSTQTGPSGPSKAS